MIIHAKCPYCGHVNKQNLERAANHTLIENCNLEDGGCDQDFIIYAKPEFKLDVRGIHGMKVREVADVGQEART